MKKLLLILIALSSAHAKYIFSGNECVLASNKTTKSLYYKSKDQCEKDNIIDVIINTTTNTSYHESYENGHVRFKIPYVKGEREGIGYWYYHANTNVGDVFAKLYFKKDELYKAVIYSSSASPINPSTLQATVKIKDYEMTYVTFHDLNFNGMEYSVDLTKEPNIPDDKKFLVALQYESYVKALVIMLDKGNRYKLR
jgi:hypothetical protein